MITVVSIMVLGIIVGYFIRNRRLLVKINDKLIMWAIYLLLFILGLSIGANEVIMKNLPTLGLKALALTLGGVIGSISLAWLTYVRFFKSKE
ncbi:MAG: DUF340 domain-containing protein [Bacteroidales bacterium]|nr:MAG: DUF340 domain-containing protein [Bacteroidales bacterium]